MEVQSTLFRLVALLTNYAVGQQGKGATNESSQAPELGTDATKD